MSIESARRARDVAEVLAFGSLPDETTPAIASQSDAAIIGSDTSDPASTALYVAKTDVTYNGEALTANDILLGDNSTGKQNILIRSGTIYIRYGTTTLLTLGGGSGMFFSNNAGIGFARKAITVTNGNMEIDQNGQTVGTGVNITTSYLVITASTGAFTIDSLAQPASGAAHSLRIRNESANNMTLTNLYATPSAGYAAIRTQTGAAVATAGVGVADLNYDPISGNWELSNIHG